jgi:3-oxoacyl-[acyl-carrier protein] reductase
VTGATGAIGQAISCRLAEQGASVILSGTTDSKLQELQEKIARQLADSPLPAIMACDLSNLDNADSLIDTIENSIGPIDILVNNAGITKDKLLIKMNIDDFEEVLNINLKAAFLLAKKALSQMSKRKFGRIINISSIVGYTGNPGQTNYCASKSALVGMSKAMALEYAKRNVTVNCIAPGAISSPMLQKLSEAAFNSFVSKIPTGSVGTPDDVAYPCCFLASKEAAYITGQTIHVNGGMMMY